MSLRRGHDGGYWLTKRDSKIEKELDTNFKREGTKWYPPATDITLESLRDAFKNQQVQIIGKGPSLAKVTDAIFSIGPIICINESIRIIENIVRPNFVIQYDGRLRENCLPKFATMLLGTGAKGWYIGLKNKIIFDPLRDFKIPYGSLSAIYALHFGKLMGCINARMIGFDGCINGIITYDSRLGTVERYVHEKKTGERFLTHRPRIEAVAKKLAMDLQWVV